MLLEKILIDDKKKILKANTLKCITHIDKKQKPNYA